MGNGETTSSSVRSDVSEDTSQLAQDGGEASRLPRAPQLVMVPTQGAGPVAIEIQPAAAPPVRQTQVAPAVQHPQAVPNIRQAAPPPVPRPPVAPTFRQPPAAPAVQQPQATPNIRQSQVAPEVRQSPPEVRQSVQPPPPPPVQQPQAGANLRQSQISPEMRQSQISPEMRQSRANSNAQLAWIASDVRPSQADPVDYDAQPPEPAAEPIRSMTRHDIGHDSGRAPIGLVPKILGTAAVVGVGVVAAWVLGTMVFPNAPKDEVRDRNLSILAPAPEDASAQGEQAPPADNPQTTDNSQAADNSQPADNSQSTTASVLAPAPGAFAAATPEPQPQPQSVQQQPQVQALNEQPQPQPRLNEQQISSPQQVGNEQAQSPPPQQKSEISLSPQEVDRLTNLGEKMLAQGDVSTARRLLEHAAEARSARAALLLGATYDPEGLRKMGVLGMRPDLEKAHMWYTRAAQYGSTEASRRLAGLGQRGH
jgi:hypothetical protein